MFFREIWREVLIAVFRLLRRPGAVYVGLDGKTKIDLKARGAP
jgi:hypothetical protein